MLAGYYPGVPTDTVHQLFTSRYAPGFMVEIIVGLVIPFALLAFAAAQAAAGGHRRRLPSWP